MRPLMRFLARWFATQKASRQPASAPSGNVLSILRQLRSDPQGLYLVLTLLLMIAYWYLGSPGPALLRDAPRNLSTALVNIGWSLLLLFLIPYLLWGKLAQVPRPARAGFTTGELGSNLALTFLLAVPIVGILYLGSGDASLQASYPWAGDWPGRSPLHLVGWAGMYALYYLAFEFFFRGFSLRVMHHYWGLSAALWGQTLISVLIHLGKPVAETLAAIPAGLIFGLLALRSRSLLYPFLLHLTIGLATDIFSLMHQGLLFP